MIINSVGDTRTPVTVGLQSVTPIDEKNVENRATELETAVRESTAGAGMQRSAVQESEDTRVRDMPTHGDGRTSEEEKKNSAVDEEALEASREKAQEIIAELSGRDLGLTFSVEKELDRTLISVMDSATEDVIRQIPSEEFVRMAKSMQKLRDGTLVGPDANAVLEKSELKGLLLDHEA